MAAPAEVIEAMIQAAVTEAFQQKGMSRGERLEFDSAGQDYTFMGIDLRQCMIVAVDAIEKDGWTIVREPRVGADAATAEAGLHPDHLTSENDR